MSRRIVVLPEELEVLVNEVRNLKSLLQKEQWHMEDPILDTESVMKLLNVSRRKLQEWRDEGLITFSQIKGKFYYRLSAINQMLDNHIVNNL